ncbi:hypothetical protein V8E55_006495, partial [Tylopilus felleus]
PSRLTHPKINWWTQQDYDTWIMTPVGQKESPYLEEEDGSSVPDNAITAIKASMWSCFAELVNRKHTPQVWGRLDNSGWELFHMAMEKSHPIFRFAENGWKLDKLVQNNYPAWHLFHLDEGLNWKR